MAAAYMVSEAIDVYDIQQCLRVRQEVFQDEQKIPYQVDRDGFDFSPKAHHLMVFMDLGNAPNVLIATVRGRVLEQKTIKLERMAVRRKFRKRGFGKMLLLALERKARELGCDSVVLHAQVDAMAFYQRYGFRVTGDSFKEADIVHFPMKKRL